MGTDKNSIPQLDMENASELLDKIFEESGREPNTVPMEALSAYTSFRKDRSRILKWIRIILVVLILLIPLLLVRPGFTVEPAEPAGNGQPVYKVRLDTWLPVYKVIAIQRNKYVPVSREGQRVYTVEPARNGRLDITVVLFNRQTAVRSVEVTGADNKSPVFVSGTTEDGRVRLYVADDGAGIDYDGIYAVSKSGKTVVPDYIDEAAGCIGFEYPGEACDVYIPDIIGNTLHLTIRPE